MYYQDDNNFVIKLLPKNIEHEIVLIKTEKKFSSIFALNTELNKLIKVGNSERKNEKLNWKYSIRNEDEVVIPKINFNIETNFRSLEGNYFNAKKQLYKVDQVWQRTAFLLDEVGAEIESEAEIAVAAAAEETEKNFNIPKPKKMYFDKPFFVLLKRKESHFPYFGAWLSNTELMLNE